METKFAVGDIIINKQGVIREILKVRKKSYDWCYPDMPKDDSNYFDSRNSSDPQLLHWEKKTILVKQ